MKYALRIYASVILAIVITLIMVIPAYALDLPESHDIPDVKVFRNLAETDDMLIVFERDIAYASDNYPTTPASTSYMFRLYDTDGVTEKDTISPYVFTFFESNGYGPGVDCFYFGASDNGTIWGAAVVIELYATPAFFSPAKKWRYPLAADDYTTATTQDENQEELYNFVLQLADRLAVDYADTGIILQTSGDAGAILSTYGELYFRGAIPGLQTLCPQLFYVQVYVPEKMDADISYNMTMGGDYATRLATDDIGEGFDNIGTAMGVSGAFAAAGIVLLLTLGACIFTSRKGWGIEPGLAVSSLIGIFFALIIGDVLFTIMILGSLVAGMGLVFVILLKRA